MVGGPKRLISPELGLRACLISISGDLESGRGDWRGCSSVTDFFRICDILSPGHSPRRALNLASDLLYKQALSTKRITCPGTVEKNATYPHPSPPLAAAERGKTCEANPGSGAQGAHTNRRVLPFPAQAPGEPCLSPALSRPIRNRAGEGEETGNFLSEYRHSNLPSALVSSP